MDDGAPKPAVAAKSALRSPATRRPILARPPAGAAPAPAPEGEHAGMDHAAPPSLPGAGAGAGARAAPRLGGADDERTDPAALQPRRNSMPAITGPRPAPIAVPDEGDSPTAARAGAASATAGTLPAKSPRRASLAGMKSKRFGRLRSQATPGGGKSSRAIGADSSFFAGGDEDDDAGPAAGAGAGAGGIRRPGTASSPAVQRAPPSDSNYDASAAGGGSAAVSAAAGAGGRRKSLFESVVESVFTKTIDLGHRRRHAEGDDEDEEDDEAAVVAAAAAAAAAAASASGTVRGAADPTRANSGASVGGASVGTAAGGSQGVGGTTVEGGSSASSGPPAPRRTSVVDALRPSSWGRSPSGTAAPGAASGGTSGHHDDESRPSVGADAPTGAGTGAASGLGSPAAGQSSLGMTSPGLHAASGAGLTHSPSRGVDEPLRVKKLGLEMGRAALEGGIQGVGVQSAQLNSITMRFFHPAFQTAYEVDAYTRWRLPWTVIMARVFLVIQLLVAFEDIYVLSNATNALAEWDPATDRFLPNATSSAKLLDSRSPSSALTWSLVFRGINVALAAAFLFYTWFLSARSSLLEATLERARIPVNKETANADSPGHSHAHGHGPGHAHGHSPIQGLGPVPAGSSPPAPPSTAGPRSLGLASLLTPGQGPSVPVSVLTVPVGPLTMPATSVAASASSTLVASSEVASGGGGGGTMRGMTVGTHQSPTLTFGSKRAVGANESADEGGRGPGVASSPLPPPIPTTAGGVVAAPGAVPGFDSLQSKKEEATSKLARLQRRVTLVRIADMWNLARFSSSVVILCFIIEAVLIFFVRTADVRGAVEGVLASHIYVSWAGPVIFLTAVATFLVPSYVVLLSSLAFLIFQGIVTFRVIGGGGPDGDLRSNESMDIQDLHVEQQVAMSMVLFVVTVFSFMLGRSHEVMHMYEFLRRVNSLLDRLQRHELLNSMLPKAIKARLQEVHAQKREAAAARAAAREAAANREGGESDSEDSEAEGDDDDGDGSDNSDEGSDTGASRAIASLNRAKRVTRAYKARAARRQTMKNVRLEHGPGSTAGHSVSTNDAIALALAAANGSAAHGPTNRASVAGSPAAAAPLGAAAAAGALATLPATNTTTTGRAGPDAGPGTTSTSSASAGGSSTDLHAHPVVTAFEGAVDTRSGRSGPVADLRASGPDRSRPLAGEPDVVPRGSPVSKFRIDSAHESLSEPQLPAAPADRPAGESAPTSTPHGSTSTRTSDDRVAADAGAGAPPAPPVDTTMTMTTTTTAVASSHASSSEAHGTMEDLTSPKMGEHTAVGRSLWGTTPGGAAASRLGPAAAAGASTTSAQRPIGGLGTGLTASTTTTPAFGAGFGSVGASAPFASPFSPSSGTGRSPASAMASAAVFGSPTATDLGANPGSSAGAGVGVASPERGVRRAFRGGEGDVTGVPETSTSGAPSLGSRRPSIGMSPSDPEAARQAAALARRGFGASPTSSERPALHPAGLASAPGRNADAHDASRLEDASASALAASATATASAEAREVGGGALGLGGGSSTNGFGVRLASGPLSVSGPIVGPSSGSGGSRVHVADGQGAVTAVGAAAGEGAAQGSAASTAIPTSSSGPSTTPSTPLSDRASPPTDGGSRFAPATGAAATAAAGSSAATASASSSSGRVQQPLTANQSGLGSSVALAIKSRAAAGAAAMAATAAASAAAATAAATAVTVAGGGGSGPTMVDGGSSNLIPVVAPASESEHRGSVIGVTGALNWVKLARAPTFRLESMKRGPHGVVAESYPAVTVLFCYVSDFSTHVTRDIDDVLPLVEVLDRLFSAFDEAASQFGVTKVENIGDTWMGIGGAPEQDPQHCERVCALALVMQKIVYEWGDSLFEVGGRRLEIQIGINSGAVSAGVIGNRTHHWKVFGDTVNVTARLCASSRPGHIQLSARAMNALTSSSTLPDFTHPIAFNVVRRGRISLKGKTGLHKVFWLLPGLPRDFSGTSTTTNTAAPTLSEANDRSHALTVSRRFGKPVLVPRLSARTGPAVPLFVYQGSSSSLNPSPMPAPKSAVHHGRGAVISRVSDADHDNAEEFYRPAMAAFVLPFDLGMLEEDKDAVLLDDRIDEVADEHDTETHTHVSVAEPEGHGSRPTPHQAATGSSGREAAGASGPGSRKPGDAYVVKVDPHVPKMLDDSPNKATSEEVERSPVDISLERIISILTGSDDFGKGGTGKPKLQDEEYYKIVTEAMSGTSIDFDLAGVIKDRAITIPKKKAGSQKASTNAPPSASAPAPATGSPGKGSPGGPSRGPSARRRPRTLQRMNTARIGDDDGVIVSLFHRCIRSCRGCCARRGGADRPASEDERVSSSVGDSRLSDSTTLRGRNRRGSSGFLSLGGISRRGSSAEASGLASTPSTTPTGADAASTPRKDDEGGGAGSAAAADPRVKARRERLTRMRHQVPRVALELGLTFAFIAMVITVFLDDRWRMDYEGWAMDYQTVTALASAILLVALVLGALLFGCADSRDVWCCESLRTRCSHCDPWASLIRCCHVRWTPPPEIASAVLESGVAYSPMSKLGRGLASSPSRRVSATSASTQLLHAAAAAAAATATSSATPGPPVGDEGGMVASGSATGAVSAAGSGSSAASEAHGADALLSPSSKRRPSSLQRTNTRRRRPSGSAGVPASQDLVVCCCIPSIARTQCLWNCVARSGKSVGWCHWPASARRRLFLASFFIVMEIAYALCCWGFMTSPALQPLVPHGAMVLFSILAPVSLSFIDALVVVIVTDLLLIVVSVTARIEYDSVIEGKDPVDEFTGSQPSTFVILQGIAYVFISGFIVLGVYSRLVEVSMFRYHRSIQQEHLERDGLTRVLRNILPNKEHVHKLLLGEPVVERLEDVTILYADMVGFTPLSARLEPEQLCIILDSLYSAFDKWIGRHSVFKLDTIGDCLHVVAGLDCLRPVENHAVEMVRLAWRMLEEIANQRKELDLEVNMRIGIHTGPALGAVIGMQRPRYLLWGHSAWLANKMESRGLPGEIHVSEETYHRIKHVFYCKSRGRIDIGEGKSLNTFLVVGLREEPLPAPAPRAILTTARRRRSHPAAALTNLESELISPAGFAPDRGAFAEDAAQEEPRLRERRPDMPAVNASWLLNSEIAPDVEESSHWKRLPAAKRVS